MAGNIYEIPIYIKPLGNGDIADIVGTDGVDGETGFERNQQIAVAVAKNSENSAKIFALKIAKKVGSAVLNNYGNITGDYVAQQNIQTAISEVSSLASAVSSGWTGVALYALDKGIQVVDYIIERKKNEREATFKQQRVYAMQNKS